MAGEVAEKDRLHDEDPSAREKLNELEAERDIELKFRATLQRQAAYPIQPDGPRNGSFTGTSLIPSKPKPDPLPELYGRVALSEPDPIDGDADFYIANSYARLGDIKIYNWRTPFGRQFYTGSVPTIPLLSNVAAMRTFSHTAGLMSDFVDDILDRTVSGPLFTRRLLSERDTETPSPQATNVPQSCEPVRMDSKAQRSISVKRAERRQAQGRAHPSIPFVRASQLLQHEIAAPRTEKMHAVLATLQPEQYRLVAANPHASMVVEGGPGTGKSIVASHRAAFLVDPDPTSLPQFRGEVLVVGPTKAYLEYISSAIEALTKGSPRIRLSSLNELNQWAAHKSQSLDAGLVDNIANLTSAITNAITMFRNGRDTALTVAQVYEYIRSIDQYRRPLTHDKHTLEILNGLPPHRDAVANESADAVLAEIERCLTNDVAALSQTPSQFRPTRLRFDHIIVDEAQDVTLNEWSILKELNRGGVWTILGDFNQRRADKTPRDWTSILRFVGLPDTTPRHTLNLGYRSTLPILVYAGRLLPKDAPQPSALRHDGPEPIVENRIREHLPSAVVRHVDRLQAAYPHGTIAVISTLPGSIWSQFGQKAERHNLRILNPSYARGLEFDAVVVVEPADFPPNDHRRLGLLYTALTRANQELVIVHSKPLPHALHNHRSRQSAIRVQSIQGRRPITAEKSSKGSAS